MLKSIPFILAFVLFTSCRGPEMWIPQQAEVRPAVKVERVQFLEAPPRRPYTVLGIITPPSEDYITFAAAVNAMRKEAAKRGADAVFIESQTASGNWRYNVGPGSWSGAHGTAIVWK